MEIRLKWNAGTHDLYVGVWDKYTYCLGLSFHCSRYCDRGMGYGGVVETNMSLSLLLVSRPRLLEKIDVHLTWHDDSFTLLQLSLLHWYSGFWSYTCSGPLLDLGLFSIAISISLFCLRLRPPPCPLCRQTG